MMRNQSGYPDPTAEAAIRRMMAEQRRAAGRPPVCVRSPFRGDAARNIRTVREHGRFVLNQHMNKHMNKDKEKELIL